jgi:alpha-L-arabinofuranosidase
VVKNTIMLKKEIKTIIVALVFLLVSSAYAQTKKFTVKANEVKAKVQPNMWGVFFEDINMGADGGIYAELIKNRSFEFYEPLMGWKKQGNKISEGDLLVLNRKDHVSNPRFLRVVANNAVKGNIGLTNEGFRGMGIKKNLRYDFSVMYRQDAPGIKLNIELLDSKDNIIGTAILSPEKSGTDWHKQNVSFTSAATELKGKLRIWFEGSGKIDLDMISLFPTDTWKNRPGGMRADMVQLLAEMKPGFIRFPGGCIVEGHELATRYQWKKTVGPVEDRQLIVNRWNTEFKHRPTPDYYQTFGLGFFEYFQLAEDIGADALPILNCGMACQFNTAELVPLDDMDQYVQDALDLIEFANGATTTKWGKVRSNMGHPAPFNLKMLGVGNENWGPQYVERLKLFQNAIKAKYPAIKLVYSSGTDPNGERFDYLNSQLRALNVDIIDEHYYRSPEWFLENASRYDNYDRKGPKIFAGEYAAHDGNVKNPENKNNWRAALSEASFLTGLERNADVVNLASYAPLFAHVDGWQWTPDMIWVDNLNAYGTPNYQVQKLYSLNKGTDVISILSDNKVVTGQDGYYASATVDKNKNELIIKITNYSEKAREVDFDVEGLKKLNPKGTVTYISSEDLNQVNSIENPKNVSPKEKAIQAKGKNIKATLAPYSFNVIRFKTN